MKRYDVIVVGAGISGAYAAAYLGFNNKKVLLIEKEKVSGTKLCAGGLTQKSVDFLKKTPFISDRDISRIIVSISENYSVRYRDKEVIGGKSTIPYYFTYRDILDSILVEKCSDNNVDLLFDTKVISIDESGIVKTDKDIYRADWVINSKGVSEHFKKN